MVAIAPDKIADIRKHTPSEFGGIVPELPSGSIIDHQQPKLVAGIHKCRILRAVSIAYHIQACILELQCITPVGAVADGISNKSVILMAVCPDQRLSIRLSIEIEAILAPELQTSYTYPPAISVDRTTLPVIYSYVQIIEMRTARRP